MSISMPNPLSVKTQFLPGMSRANTVFRFRTCLYLVAVVVDGVCGGREGGREGVSYGRPVRGSGTAQWYAASDSVVVSARCTETGRTDACWLRGPAVR